MKEGSRSTGRALRLQGRLVAGHELLAQVRSSELESLGGQLGEGELVTVDRLTEEKRATNCIDQLLGNLTTTVLLVHPQVSHSDNAVALLVPLLVSTGGRGCWLILGEFVWMTNGLDVVIL